MPEAGEQEEGPLSEDEDGQAETFPNLQDPAALKLNDEVFSDKYKTSARPFAFPLYRGQRRADYPKR